MKINLTHNTIKISISGPESCGKTTLAHQLSAEFDLPVIPEYARIYLEQGHQIINNKDLLRMTRHQIQSEKLSPPPSAMICDTDVLVLYIWCKEKFPPVPKELFDKLMNHTYDITLLCAPDLPWTIDPLRENPLDRDRLFNEYLLTLKQLKRPFEVIHGHGDKRFELAKKIISPLLK